MNQGFCVFINTLYEGSVPSLRSENGKPCIFATRVEAEHEIADFIITRLQEFIDGEREFEDAMTVEEYVVVVDVMSDGSIVTADGSVFG
jgi:hypothetical protein